MNMLPEQKISRALSQPSVYQDCFIQIYNNFHALQISFSFQVNMMFYLAYFPRPAILRGPSHSDQMNLMAKCRCPKSLESAAGRAQQLFWLHELVPSPVETSNSVIRNVLRILSDICPNVKCAHGPVSSTARTIFYCMQLLILCRNPVKSHSRDSFLSFSCLYSCKSNVAPGPAFIVSDDQMADDFDKIAEQRRQAKRAALLAKTMKRKEEIENKVNSFVISCIFNSNLKKFRQKILDDYKRRKAEKEMGIEPGSNTPHAVSGRGHSQPPFIRTKSQMSESSKGGGSNKFFLKLLFLAHKLFAKATPKSNRGLIINALQYSVFPGAVNDSTRMKTMNDLAGSDAKHFLILFRDHKCQYRGLYSWDQVICILFRIFSCYISSYICVNHLSF
uniref:CKK domain-containing protein n=1 Tax=Heterorhabditis bacteriophora TaxID=37862 RepID=A0A1I7WPU8_HETBA